MSADNVSIRMKNGTTRVMARSYATILVQARAAQWVDPADAKVKTKGKRPAKSVRPAAPPRTKPKDSGGTYRRRDMRPEG